MHSLILATMLTLTGGYTNAGVSGEVVAINAATTNEAATVTISAVESLTTYTNITAQVVTLETAYALTYTNYDGSAAIATNVIGYVDYDDFTTTNGLNKIIAGPTRFDLPITNIVVTGQAQAETYTLTNELGTVTTSNHFGTATLSGAYLFGGGVYVDGATDGDKVNVIVK